MAYGILLGVRVSTKFIEYAWRSPKRKILGDELQKLKDAGHSIFGQKNNNTIIQKEKQIK